MKHERNIKSASTVQLNLVYDSGDVKPTRKKKGLSVDERYIARVLFGAPDECWPWLGGKSSGSIGYGVMDEDGKTVYAHRYAFKRKHGYYPDEFVLHSCDNPLCQNWGHLSKGSVTQNSADMVLKGRSRRSFKAVEALEIVRKFALGWVIEKIAVFFKASVSSVRKVLAGKTHAKTTGLVFEKGHSGKYELIRAELRKRFDDEAAQERLAA